MKWSFKFAHFSTQFGSSHCRVCWQKLDQQVSIGCHHGTWSGCSDVRWQQCIRTFGSLRCIVCQNYPHVLGRIVIRWERIEISFPFFKTWFQTKTFLLSPRLQHCWPDRHHRSLHQWRVQTTWVFNQQTPFIIRTDEIIVLITFRMILNDFTVDVRTHRLVPWRVFFRLAAITIEPRKWNCLTFLTSRIGLNCNCVSQWPTNAPAMNNSWMVGVVRAVWTVRDAFWWAFGRINALKKKLGNPGFGFGLN